MDVQRLLLIGAAAALSFMLLTEWVAFKETKAVTSNSVSQRLSDQQSTAIPDSVVDEFPQPTESAQSMEGASVALPTSEDDIPEAPQPVTQATDLPAASAPASVNGRNLVQVKTDVLELAIDLKGGDILEAALPAYPAAVDTPDIPFVILENSQRRTYVAQSGLVGPNGIDSKGRAEYQTAANRYSLKNGEDTLVVDLLWQSDNGVEVTKRFTVRRGDYLIDVDFLVNNNSSERWRANLFGQIKRDSSKDPTASTSMGMQSFVGAALTREEERFSKQSFDDMADEPINETLPGGWIAMLQHYFLSAWIPDAEKSHNYSTRVTRSGMNIAGFTSPALILDPGSSGSTGASFYVGPKDQYRLQEISPYLELTVDYGWLWWIAQPLFWLLIKMYAFAGNWGVAIILLTLLIKAVFYKLSATSYRSMARMRVVQPKMQAIREQYADDKQKQSHAMMELYKKEKVNPMMGCLPVLVQMPVFIALYWVLMESVELRQAPFALWINDLSVMDPLFILPLIMGASMWFMQKLNPPPPDPMQAKIMQWLPIMFTFFFLWFPAGLVLYWVVNNLLSMAQQYVITRQIEKSAAAKGN